MGFMTLYAIKSAVCLMMLYLPYTLLMRRDTFHSFNRMVLLAIVILSLILPCLDISLTTVTPIQTAIYEGEHSIVEVGRPVIVAEGVTSGAVISEAGESNGASWAAWLVAIYIIGVVACFLVKTIEMIRLVRFIRSGCLWISDEDGVRIYCHAGNVSPFSWMNKIVISETDYYDNPLILRHERAHIARCHSWDNLFLSLVETFQWFNPCIWMLDHSLKEVHEYEVDAAILKQGITAKNYMSLMIKKAIGASSYTFTDGFNHSLIKNRITMMMKEKTNKWRCTKALYFIPVAAVALGALATPEFSSTAKSVDVDKVTDLIPNGNVFDGKNAQTATNDTWHTAVNDADSEAMNVPNDSSEVFDIVEILPEFPGGPAELMGYISKNLHYPEEALKVSITARVMVTFVVTSDGNIRDVSVTHKSITLRGEAQPDDEGFEDAIESFDKECIRVINSMPKWKPGIQQGRAVNTRYSVPIQFLLN